MDLTNEQISLLKKREMLLLKEFIGICEKLKITYYALGGTLLGAKRHNGFIPWDDDIDVGLMRQDFEIFRKEGAQYLAGWIFMQDCYTDSDYPLNHIKLRDKETVFIETSVKSFNINHGVFIDIFPIDYYPEAGIRRFFLELRNKIFCHRISLEFDNRKTHTGIRRLKDVFLKAIYPDYRTVVKQRDALLRKVSQSKSKLVRNYCGAWGKREIVPIEYFSGTKIMQFEDISLFGPKETEKYLTSIYGDYMQLPPEENRRPHHFVECVDFSKVEEK